MNNKPTKKERTLVINPTTFENIRRRSEVAGYDDPLEYAEKLLKHMVGLLNSMDHWEDDATKERAGL